MKYLGLIGLIALVCGVFYFGSGFLNKNVDALQKTLPAFEEMIK